MTGEVPLKPLLLGCHLESSVRMVFHLKASGVGANAVRAKLLSDASTLQISSVFRVPFPKLVFLLDVDPRVRACVTRLVWCMSHRATSVCLFLVGIIGNHGGTACFGKHWETFS